MCDVSRINSVHGLNSIGSMRNMYVNVAKHYRFVLFGLYRRLLEKFCLVLLWRNFAGEFNSLKISLRLHEVIATFFIAAAVSKISFCALKYQYTCHQYL